MNTDPKSIIEKVRKDIESRNEVISFLYSDSKLLGFVNAFVRKNGGDDEDGKDMFTFGIMTFIKQCYRSEFELTKPVTSYIFSIAKYEWYRIRKKSFRIVYDGEDHIEGEAPSVETIIIEEEKRAALRNALSQLDEKCIEVIRLWASNTKMRQIALTLGYTSAGMARKKKHECINKLKTLIKDI